MERQDPEVHTIRPETPDLDDQAGQQPGSGSLTKTEDHPEKSAASASNIPQTPSSPVDKPYDYFPGLPEPDRQELLNAVHETIQDLKSVHTEQRVSQSFPTSQRTSSKTHSPSTKP